MSDDKKPFVPKTPMDFQRMKLERLMANPEKPVIIPETPREKKGFTVPEFVRNVMGSSAGAGSGEFHVYRHLRRKEYTRQKAIEEKGEKEKLDDDYQRKIEENQQRMEERTAKKRAKRLKKKEKLKKLKSSKVSTNKKEKTPEVHESSSDEDSSGNKSDASSGTEEEQHLQTESKQDTDCDQETQRDAES